MDARTPPKWSGPIIVIVRWRSSARADLEYAASKGYRRRTYGRQPCASTPASLGPFCSVVEDNRQS